MSFEINLEKRNFFEKNSNFLYNFKFGVVESFHFNWLSHNISLIRRVDKTVSRVNSR